MNIYIDNRQDLIEINSELKDLIEKIVVEALKLEGEDIDSEVSISFVDNEEIRGLNKTYRNKDEATDVLSFPMEEDFPMPIKILGDIIISSERAKEQAREFNHSEHREIGYLVAHSMFHLMGYDHMEEEEKKIMRKREEETLARLGIDRNYKGE